MLKKRKQLVGFFLQTTFLDETCTCIICCCCCCCCCCICIICICWGFICAIAFSPLQNKKVEKMCHLTTTNKLYSWLKCTSIFGNWCPVHHGQQLAGLIHIIGVILRCVSKKNAGSTGGVCFRLSVCESSKDVFIGLALFNLSVLSVVYRPFLTKITDTWNAFFCCRKLYTKLYLISINIISSLQSWQEFALHSKNRSRGASFCTVWIIIWIEFSLLLFCCDSIAICIPLLCFQASRKLGVFTWSTSP